MLFMAISGLLVAIIGLLVGYYWAISWLLVAISGLLVAI